MSERIRLPQIAVISSYSANELEFKVNQWLEHETLKEEVITIQELQYSTSHNGATGKTVHSVMIYYIQENA